MNILNRKQYQRGVGLLEVLIALGVIAVAVVAVLGLQGTLMSGSATSKARNEAVALAREKTEELRNSVERDQFVDALSLAELDPDPEHSPDSEDGLFYFLDPAGDINGVNARFTRSWAIADVVAGVKNTRDLVMRVSWVNAQNVESHVELNTLITFASPLISALNGDAGTESVLPGERPTGYEGLVPATLGEDVISNADLGFIPLKPVDTDFGITDILHYANGHVQVRRRKFEVDEYGNPICLAVAPATCVDCAVADTVEVGGIDYCVVFTAFGGTLLRFDGTLYLDLKINTLKDIGVSVKATSPAYCAMKSEEPEACGDVPELKCVEYLCYASGDCTNGGTDCPTGDVLDAMNLSDLNLNGGWRGRIGHFFYDDTEHYKAPPDSKVCMSKYYDVDTDSMVDNETISRSYYGLRSEASPSTLKWREGINQSYSCHNTLFVEFNESGDVCDGGYEKMITEGIVWNSFKDHEVIRELLPDKELNPNIVLGKERTYCDIVAIYGAVYFDEDVLPDVGGATISIVGKTVFDTVIATPSGGSVPGECVTQESAPSDAWDLIYACNFIDDEWTGVIEATATRSYTIDTINYDFTCVGSKSYTATATATGRNSVDLRLGCWYEPLAP